jgi:hypothetical protein
MLGSLFELPFNALLYVRKMRLRRQRAPFAKFIAGEFLPSVRKADPQQVEIDIMDLERSRLGIRGVDFTPVQQALGKGDLAAARTAAGHINLDNALNVLSQRFHDFTIDERVVLAEGGQVSLSTPQAVVSLSRAVRYVVENEIPGAMAECGVYAGGSIMVIIRTLLMMGRTDRDIYLFDTFEGMPPPDPQDVFYTGVSAAQPFEHLKRGEEGHSNWVYAPLDEVKKRVLRLGYPEERIHFIKGLVEDTLPSQAPEQLALLRLDTDFYSSTKHEFIHLYPRLSNGGMLIIDDYGAFKGVQQATDEYIAEKKLPIYLHRADEHVRFAVKVP